MGKIKILLMSDLHLGIERENSLISGEERLSTFMNIISLARKHDILLIAGDLINSENIDPSYYEIIRKEFSSLLEEGKEIFYTPGAGELTDLGKLNPEIKEIITTFTFSDSSDSYVYKSSLGDIFVYGLQNMSVNNTWSIERKVPEGFHIGLFYTDFSPQITGVSDTGCIKKDDMKKMNLDFFALGKSHNFKMFRSSNKILGACSGSAEPCSMDEYGERYAVSMDLDGNNLPGIKRIAVNKVKILNEDVDCRQFAGQTELIEKIKLSWPGSSLININFSGERDFLIEKSFITKLTDYFRNLKIHDNSIPTLKVIIEENINSDSLKGLFYRNLRDAISEAGNKMDNRLLADIILQRNGNNKTGEGVLCDS